VSFKTTIATTPGSGLNLLAEVESDSSKAQVVYIYEGRLIPVSIGASASHVVTISTTATTDLLTKAPGGAVSSQGVNFLRVMLRSTETGSVTWWDNGLDPGTVTGGPQLVAGNYFDFPNIPELTNLYFRAVTASVAVILLWYKTK
jgi:hypothetical protein